MLRLGLAEMLYGDEQKPGVAINEAVELVKKYGAEDDYQFVNGLLGAVARERGETPRTPMLTLGIDTSNMQPLWPSLIQPERLFAQKSVFFR